MDLFHLPTTAAALAPQLAIGGTVSLLGAAAATALGAVDRSGFFAGWAVGTAIFLGCGWPGLLVLGGFVGIGHLATRWGWERKTTGGLAQTGRGRRSARHVLANGAVAAVCGLLATSTLHGSLLQVACAGSLAAAAADTVASEVGQLVRRRTLLLTTWEVVPPGTDGGVSLVGTAAGWMAAGALAFLALYVGFIGPPEVLPVWTAGFLAMLIDSLLGATLERRGLLGNESVNFWATLFGAVVAAVLALWRPV